MDWTNDAIEQLGRLWADGHSATQIGARLGVSKNTVIGKAHRLKLPGRASPIRRQTPGEQGAKQSGRLPDPKLADTKPLVRCDGVVPGQAVAAPVTLEELKLNSAGRLANPDQGIFASAMPSQWRANRIARSMRPSRINRNKRKRDPSKLQLDCPDTAARRGRLRRAIAVDRSTI